jgi:hypothetical protein
MTHSEVAERPDRQDRFVPVARWLPHLRAAAVPWLVAHLLVGAALAITAARRDGLPQTGGAPGATGLLAWDAGWYAHIAAHGYGHIDPYLLRFFPLLPVAVRAVAAPTGLPYAVVLVGLCWLAALGYGAVLHALTLRETGDAAVARRAVWLAQLFPGANVLVLGYSEAFAGLLAVAFLFVLRWRPGPWLIPLGLLSGLVRPTGLLLAVPALIDALPAGRRTGWRLGAAAAPIAGTGLYLAWCGWRHGNAWLPFRAQTGGSLRGGLATNPLAHLFTSTGSALPWPAQLALVAAALGLLWVCVRRLAPAYAAWTVCILAAAVTAVHLQSLPRYVAAAFPLAIAGAFLARRAATWYPMIVVSMVGFTWIAMLSADVHYVP